MSESTQLIYKFTLIRLELTITVLSIMIFFPTAFAELTNPTTSIQVPELEKSDMQTIYEDQEKKIMLPYDPEKITHFLMVGMLLTFIGGMGSGYILNEILRSKKK